MRDLLILAVHLLVTCAKLVRPGGIRAVAAESLLLKHQFLISNRSRQRAPNLTTLDRFLLGLTALFVNPRRLAKLGALVRPATLFKFHRALVDRKYRLLFSSALHRCKPGPKGPSAELIAAIVEMKRRNPRFGYLRIAQQIAHAFGVEIDKDVVRRVLAKHYRPDDSGATGPSWLAFIAHGGDDDLRRNGEQSELTACRARSETTRSREHPREQTGDARARRHHRRTGIGGAQRAHVDEGDKADGRASRFKVVFDHRVYPSTAFAAQITSGPRYSVLHDLTSIFFKPSRTKFAHG